MLLSIIIPVYNIKDYLRRCIESLLCNNKEYEIILVDDGSTDGSGEICEEYGRLFPQITVYHKVNGGVSSARNYGLTKAKGKYIYFVDGDDYVYGISRLLAKLYEVDCDAFLISYQVLGKNDVIVKQHIYTTPNLSVKQLIKCKEKHHHAPWEYIFKRERLLQYDLCFCTKLKYAEDWVFVTQYLANIIALECITGFTYCYRNAREGSAMNQIYDNKQILLHFTAFDMVNAIVPNEESRKFVQKEKQECFSYILNIVKQNISKTEYCEIQSMIRRRICLSLLKGANMKFLAKVILAYISIKII